jgi:cell wall-associated NlpC family hydrolase
VVGSDARHGLAVRTVLLRLAAAVGAVAVALVSTGGVLAAPTAPTSALVRPPGNGLSGWPGWIVQDPQEQQRQLAALLLRERREAARVPVAAPAAPVLFATTTAPSAPSPDGTLLVGPEQVAIALRFALDQIGKAYMWGASGPDVYDCSGLTMSAYAAAGVLLPRTSAEQALVGRAVALADLLPGDLVFWAYFPTDLSTVHHVALYLGGGLVVHAPQAGDVVRVSPLWLPGYAGAVRVAGGPAIAALPTPPASGSLPPGNSGNWGNSYGGPYGNPSSSGGSPSGSPPPSKSAGRPSSKPSPGGAPPGRGSSGDPTAPAPAPPNAPVPPPPPPPPPPSPSPPPPLLPPPPVPTPPLPTPSITPLGTPPAGEPTLA